MSMSLTRGLDMLLLFRDPQMDGLTVSDAASFLKVDKSVASRTLSRLLASGFVARSPLDNRRYILGPAIVQLGAQASAGVSLVNLARPYMLRLQAATNETVSLQVRRGDQRYCIDQVESSQPIRRVVEMNTPLPLHSGSSGAVMLAFAADYGQGDVADFVTDANLVENLRERVRKTHEDGFAVSIGQRVDGISGISAPVRNNRGHAIAAMAVSGPAIRWKQEQMLEWKDMLLDSVQSLSADFGGLAA